MSPWPELKWWSSGENQVIEEKLDALDKQGHPYSPSRECLYRALSLTSPETCKVAVVGQDPYPEARYCTGVAFSIPSSLRKYPPTLQVIYQELLNDLHFERKTGSLESWCNQGVLLWNSTPTYQASLSKPKVNLHAYWTEWTYLTKEIIETLSDKGIVFVLLGSRAREYSRYISLSNNYLIELGHPSPIGYRANNPFKSSRLFSVVNDKLVNNGLQAIDWRL